MAVSLNSRFFGTKISATHPKLPARHPTVFGLPAQRHRFSVVPTALFKTAKQTGPKSKKNAPKNQKQVKAQQFSVGVGKASKKISLGFTKSNELFVGRAAMIGIATAILGELLTGKGALAQLGFETGLPIQDLDYLIPGVAAFNLIAALTPTKGVFVPDEKELEERPAGALQDSRISLATPRKFFGIKGFGFTKQNELFVGRVAQLGFAAALIGEGITGKGILAQFDIETGLPLNETEPLLLAFIAFTLFAAINEGTGRFTDD